MTEQGWQEREIAGERQQDIVDGEFTAGGERYRRRTIMDKMFEFAPLFMLISGCLFGIAAQAYCREHKVVFDLTPNHFKIVVIIIISTAMLLSGMLIGITISRSWFGEN